MAPALLTIAALALDWLIGDPQNWPHPVRMIGHLIVTAERLCRQALDKLQAGPAQWVFFGALLALGVIASTALGIWVVLDLAWQVSSVLWLVLCLYLVFAIFCLRDLEDHVNKVEEALEALDLDEARRALSWIVGLDTAHLSAEGIRRATVETIAENFADGLVAPLLYLALGGPVLAWAYKAVNTLDSMVGYKNDRYLYLGRFSARLDDVANFVPARIAALILILGAKLTGLDSKGAFRLWRREGNFHSSPNSGQTEAAMAGALGTWLGGTNRYGGQLIDKPIIGAGGGEVTRQNVLSALKLAKISTLMSLALALIIEALISLALKTPWGWGLVY